MRYWKSGIGLQDKPSRQLVLTWFSKWVPKQWVHRWQHICQSCLREYPVESCSTGTPYSAKHDVVGLTYAVRNPLQLPMDSPWRINCFPDPNDSHMSMACWTSAVVLFGWLRTGGPVKVANARFWSFNSSGRPLIQFVANAASSRMFKLARSRKSLISAYWRYGGARIVINLVLDIQSPRTVRTCHSVGTTRSREAGTNSSGCKRFPTLWKFHLGFFASQECPLAVILLLKVLCLLQPPKLSWFWSQNKEMFTAEDLVFCYGQAQTVLLPYDFFLVSIFGEDGWRHPNYLGMWCLW